MLARLRHALSTSAHYSRQNAVLVGLFGTTTFPIYYLVWAYLYPQPYENLPLRLLGMALCIPLLKRRWPRRLERGFTLYWALTLLYSLPFFFTFMLLKNQLGLLWSMSTLAAMFLLVLAVVDWVLIITLYVLGSVLAWALYLAGGGDPGLFGDYLQQMPIYAFVILAGSIFNYTSHRVKEERLNAHAAIGRNIAHELRTPLAGMRGAVDGLLKFLPDLVRGHDLARQAGLPVRPIRQRHLEQLSGLAGRLRDEIDHSGTIIDMLLLSAGQSHLKPDRFERVAIHDTLRHTLERYPFNAPRDRTLVHWEPQDGFHYWGSDLLVTHVLFNLLKNALHSIHQAGKGEIHILTRSGSRFHELVFEDTGAGIPHADQRHVFDYFYSSKSQDQGSGLGLSFCRLALRSLGGEIRCQSEPGLYTRFILTFPVENPA